MLGLLKQKYPNVSTDASGKTTQKNEFHQLYYHYLGNDQVEDVLCFHFPDNPDYFLYKFLLADFLVFLHLTFFFRGAGVSDDGKFLIVNVYKDSTHNNLLYYYKLEPESQIKGLLFDIDGRLNTS